MPRKVRGKGIQEVFNSVKDATTNAYNNATSYVNNIMHGHERLSPKVQGILNQVGNSVISSIVIGRTPVQSIITGIIKTVSSTPYDQLFHLFIIMTTTDGKQVLLEKNERINMDINRNVGGERISVPRVPSGLTINQLMNNTASYMGDRFIPYSAKSSNCQDFIIGVLKSNHIDTPETVAFVKQDTESIFKDPNFRKLANSVTDVAGRFNVLMQGGEINRFKDNELDNTQLDALMYKYKIPSHGCFVKNKLPIRIRNGFYIINLNGHSHWTGLLKNGNHYMYYDSMGFPAPKEVEQKIGKDYIWSDVQMQDMDSSACGFYVVSWMRFMKNNPTEEQYMKFLKLFSKNTVRNEHILGGLLR